jgi:hypothetical protein
MRPIECNEHNANPPTVRGRIQLAIYERFRHNSCDPVFHSGRKRLIAEHSCRKYCGRVGRSAAVKALDEEAVRLAVTAHVRHAKSNYDNRSRQSLCAEIFFFSFSAFSISCVITLNTIRNGSADPKHKEPQHAAAPKK